MNSFDALFCQLADRLGLTPAELQAGTTENGRLTEMQERVELLNAFGQLKDQQARRRCLSFVQSELQRSLKQE